MLGSVALRTGITPGGALAARWAQDPLWRIARSVPSLDLRFADNKSLVDAVTGQSLITFTRANNTATVVNSQGVIETVNANIPRFQHDPVTGACLGLLVEEQRTNSIRNNTMVGAVAGTPGTLPTNWGSFVSPAGITRTVVGTGTINGITYIDIRYSGTPSTTGEISFYPEGSATSATSSQTWSSSAWMAVVGGSTSNVGVISIRNLEQNSGSYVREVATNFVGQIGPVLTRFSVTGTTGASINQIVQAISVSASSVAAIDITLRIGLPQLEQGAFATSVIPTTNAGTVTRSADIATITGGDFSGWYNQSQGTVFTQAQGAGFFAGGTRRYFEISDGSSNNRLVGGYTNTVTTRFLIANGGVTQADVYPNGTPANLTRYAAAYATNSAQASSAGTLGTEDTTVTLPAANTTCYLGADNVAGSGFILCGTISRLTYWPQRLPNATLQALTR